MQPEIVGASGCCDFRQGIDGTSIHRARRSHHGDRPSTLHLVYDDGTVQFRRTHAIRVITSHIAQVLATNSQHGHSFGDRHVHLLGSINDPVLSKYSIPLKAEWVTGG